MTGYRRNFVAGGSFFFTVNPADRRLRLLNESIDALRTAFRETQRHHPFTIDAIVVLPDHLHSVWTLLHALAAYQNVVLPQARRRRADLKQSYRQRRTRYLAAPLLGAHDSRRDRFFAPHRLRSHQPCQTWACETRQRLAIFVVSSHGEKRCLSRGLGRRCFRPRWGVWREALNTSWRGDGYRCAPPILRSAW